MRFCDAIEAVEDKSVSDFTQKARMKHIRLFHSMEMINLALDIVKVILDCSVVRWLHPQPPPQEHPRRLGQPVLRVRIQVTRQMAQSQNVERS